MAGRQAKILTEDNYNDLLIFAATTRHSLRNQLIVRLSTKAGLRAGEIANLTWDMVLNPAGEVGPVIELRDWAAKKRSGRLIPIHPSVRDDLVAWRRILKPFGPLITSGRGSAMTPVSIVNWFASAYQAIGVSGCSSSCEGKGKQCPLPSFLLLHDDVHDAVGDFLRQFGHVYLVAARKFV